MTIVATTLVHPNPGTTWDDIQKQLKRASGLARKHGAENVTVMVNMVGGPGTNTIGFLTTAEDWAKYGQIQQALAVGVISETEAAALKEYDRKVLDIINVDDFAQHELGVRAEPAPTTTARSSMHVA